MQEKKSSYIPKCVVQFDTDPNRSISLHLLLKNHLCISFWSDSFQNTDHHLHHLEPHYADTALNAYLHFSDAPWSVALLGCCSDWFSLMLQINLNDAFHFMVCLEWCMLALFNWDVQPLPSVPSWHLLGVPMKRKICISNTGKTILLGSFSFFPPHVV